LGHIILLIHQVTGVVLAPQIARNVLLIENWLGSFASLILHEAIVVLNKLIASFAFCKAHVLNIDGEI
jgi:hypothetical protein